jgi:hypothetical protein
MSWPSMRRYRTSVPSGGGQPQKACDERDEVERTVKVRERGDAFPDGDAQGEIEDVPQDRVALGAWGTGEGRPLPSPGEEEDEEAEG